MGMVGKKDIDYECVKKGSKKKLGSINKGCDKGCDKGCPCPKKVRNCPQKRCEIVNIVEFSYENTCKPYIFL